MKVTAVCHLWKQIDQRFLDKNFPAVFMFCKLNILLFSSLLNMITASVGRWVSSRWVGGSVGKWSVVSWSVVGGFNKTPNIQEIFWQKGLLNAVFQFLK